MYVRAAERKRWLRSCFRTACRIRFIADLVFGNLCFLLNSYSSNRANGQPNKDVLYITFQEMSNSLISGSNDRRRASLQSP